MPHCVALKCRNQSKTNQDPTIRFLSFPKDKKLRSAWIHAVGRTTLPKDSRLCSKHFEDHCFRDSYLMEVRIMGSSKMKSPLKYDAVPTLFANRSTKAKCTSSEKRVEKRRRLETIVKTLLRENPGPSCIESENASAIDEVQDDDIPEFPKIISPTTCVSCKMRMQMNKRREMSDASTQCETLTSNAQCQFPLDACQTALADHTYFDRRTQESVFRIKNS